MDTKQNIKKTDFNSICRLCLNKDRRLKPIFHTNNIQTDDQSFHGMIINCTGINVSTINIINFNDNNFNL